MKPVTATKNKTTLYFVDVPVYVKYLYRFRSLNKIYFGAGGYVGSGLFCNESITFQYEGADAMSSSESVNWGSEGDYKRLDYGVSAKCGFVMDSGFNICVSYDHGFCRYCYIGKPGSQNQNLTFVVGIYHEI